jgi:hypothetical protein
MSDALRCLWGNPLSGVVMNKEVKTRMGGQYPHKEVHQVVGSSTICECISDLAYKHLFGSGYRLELRQPTSHPRIQLSRRRPVERAR